MILNQSNSSPDDSAASPVDAAGGTVVGVPPESTPFDLFKRDYRLFVIALYHGALLIAGSSLVCALLGFVIAFFAIKPQYEASCALVRQELRDLRQSGMPSGFTQPQLSVILNMIRSRANLQHTIERLKLNTSTDALFGMLTIRQAGKNSNYISLCARAGTPEMASDVANMQAEVFVDDYRRLLQENLQEILSNSERNRLQLSNEISALSNRLQTIGMKNNIVSVDDELNKIGQQIVSLETLIQRDNAQQNAIRSQIKELTVMLKDVPEEVAVYQEQNSSRENTLEKEKVELARLRQVYTDINPIVKKQVEIIKAQEEALKQETGKERKQQRVVFGKNQVYLHMSTDLNRLRSELSGCVSRVEEYRGKVAELQQRQIKINELRPEFKNISDSLEQKKEMLSRLDETIKNLKMFLERSYSDITIYETAVPPKYPIPTRRKVVTLAGGLVGFMLSFLVVMVMEGLNLKVRSRADLEEALHIRALGLIPELTPEMRTIFYSSLQQLLGFVEETFPGRKNLKVSIIPDAGDEKEQKIYSEFMNLLDVRDIRTLTIVSLTDVDASQTQFLINDFLYGLSSDAPKPDKDGKLYFNLDDMAFISPPDNARLEAIQKQYSEYTVILWKLFDYNANPQFFIRLCEFSDMTVLPLLYDRSDKKLVAPFIRELQVHGVPNLCGVLYGIKGKYYSMVI